MILRSLRSAGAMVLGIVVAMVLIVAVEAVSAVLHPFPPGVYPSDMEACREHVANYPQWLLAAFAPAWWFMVFASTWVATRLGAARHPAHGIALGLLLLAAVAFNMYMLPYPLWFEAGNWIMFPLATLAAVWLARGKKPPAAPAKG